MSSSRRSGRELYEKFFRGYTRKQWGLDPSELDKSVTARVPTRTNRDDRYFGDEYQFMPKHGYTRMFERMLDHPNINIMVQTDYADVKDLVPHRRVIFTGPIDEFFGFRFGKLPYRSLRFRHVMLDKEWHQPVAVVNYPQTHDYTRVTEYKHLTGQAARRRRRSLTSFPRRSEIRTTRSRSLRTRSCSRSTSASALATPNVWFVGRLATYRYYNMDQIVGQALATFRRINEALPADADTSPARVDEVRRGACVLTVRASATAEKPALALAECKGKLSRNDRSSGACATPDAFWWATGIEDTFITGPGTCTGRTLDEYELTGHYGRWREDLGLIAELGVSAARYGVPWHRIQPERRIDGTGIRRPDLDRLLDLGIEPIVDLVHYGLPRWIEGAYLESGLSRAASRTMPAALAERFRGRIFWYTPLNEPRITAWYCGRLGWWPPFRRGWRGFVAVMLAVAAASCEPCETLGAVDPEIVAGPCRRDRPLRSRRSGACRRGAAAAGDRVPRPRPRQRARRPRVIRFTTG